MLNFNLTQNIQITQSYYVKLKFEYVKNSIQNFNKDLSGSFLNTNTKCFLLYILITTFYINIKS